MYTLLLRLSAPLQSWGSESMYDNRETDSMPTKSGVIGMLAAALGMKRNENLEDLRKLGFGVRIDLPGIKLNDFQITEMGEKLNSNLSNRSYLSDAIFLAGLESADLTYLKKIENALKNPKYSVFLGRRSCPPTQPLVLGIRNEELYQSLLDEKWLVPEWRQKTLFRFSNNLLLRIVTDGSSEGAVKKDVPLSFSTFRREYGYRYVTEMPAKIVTREPCSVSTEHDPMSELR
ncbi:MAG: type I-E CRISPR-associated protein Cas5/CasD [Ruminococcus sp.]|nr:type I-E CRISPR-associated protein Cas5/CasD [Ruminococcus sp.]